ncbi:electron transport complex subunit RsxC [Sesbania bispinosa]|nr:electron transport complex subunit RsxC [Sesbania bispinosa]
MMSPLDPPPAVQHLCLVTDLQPACHGRISIKLQRPDEKKNRSCRRGQEQPCVRCSGATTLNPIFRDVDR